MTNYGFLLNWFDRVWHEPNSASAQDAIRMYLSDKGVAHGLHGEPLHGPTDYIPFYLSFKNAFPDIHIAIDDYIEEGPMIAARCSANMTINGKYEMVTGMFFANIYNGKLMESWNNWDFLGLLEKMGAVDENLLMNAVGNKMEEAV